MPLAKIGNEHNEYITEWSLIVYYAQQCGEFLKCWTEISSASQCWRCHWCWYRFPICNTQNIFRSIARFEMNLLNISNRFSLIIIILSQCWCTLYSVSQHFETNIRTRKILQNVTYLYLYTFQFTCIKEKQTSVWWAYLCETCICIQYKFKCIISSYSHTPRDWKGQQEL